MSILFCILLGTSPHSEDGTQGKLDFAEAQGFVNNILIQYLHMLLVGNELGPGG
jgi:hypothetical protein